MKRLRHVTEAEVIAEFLKNEFYQEEFHHDRDQFEQLVLGADVTDERANALRRALLFRRRGHLWRELPVDTAWWEVQIEAEDLERVRVFPRAQWRKVANGSFLLRDIVRQIRNTPFRGRTRDFIAKVQAFSYRLRTTADDSAVLLIGMDDRQPVTVLEGNHRLAAALLASPEVMQKRFRVFCGLSVHMPECCWYQTNVANLWRYGRNRTRNLFYDRDADVERLMDSAAPRSSTASPALTSVAADKVVTQSK
jgi:hypothetical protein